MSTIKKVIRRIKNSVTGNDRYKDYLMYVCTENIRRHYQSPINRVKLFYNTFIVIWLTTGFSYGRKKIKRWIKLPPHKPRYRIKLEVKWDCFPCCRWVKINMDESGD